MLRLFVVLAIVLAFNVYVALGRGGLLSVNTNSQRIVDQDGRERIFHGTNVVYKSPPYYPITDKFDPLYSLSKEDIQFMKQWGINAVRLGVMWAGVEPTRGTYDSNYMNIMKKIVADLAANDIYTLVEMHQDDFSRKFCGEGVPDWAAIPSFWAEHFLQFPEPVSFPYNLSADGIPYASDCLTHDWPEYSFTVAHGSAVQNLFDNYDGILDSFSAYWNFLASTWKSEEYVIGYEIMNEPWCGDIFLDPELLVPGVADRVNLQPAWERVHEEIRKADDQHIVMFEGVTWDDVTLGFTRSLGGPDYLNRTVYAYHVYVPPNLNAAQAMAEHQIEVKRLGCGWFCTETNDADAANECDKYLQSWMYWDYKIFGNLTGDWLGMWNSDGTVNQGSLNYVTRTYAMAIAGNTTSMFYNTTSHDFKLVYKVSISCTLPTEIYLYEQLNYPNGYNVKISPSNAVTWSSPQKNSIFVSKNSNTKHGTEVTVIITAN